MSSFLRRLAILEYLRASKQAKSTEDILQHLINGGHVDEEQKDTALLRLVQRDMKFLYGDEPEEGNSRSGLLPAESLSCDEEINIGNELGLLCTRGPGKSWLWSLAPYNHQRFDYEKMPHYMAIAFSMTQKHLSRLLPRNTLAELNVFFSRAEQKLQQSSATLNSQSYDKLKDSIEFFQRGQRLQPAEYDIEHLDTIYRAIIRRKRLSMRYRNKNYLLHPLGVAILLPKLYLVAIKDQTAEAPVYVESANYRHFLIHKIQSVHIEQKNAVDLADFSLKGYLEKGFMDVLIDPKDSREYQLELRIVPKINDGNLISDLHENPLAADQKISQVNSNEYLLTVSLRRTIQLRNWILNLGDECKILSPDIIRKDVIASLQAMLSQYK